MAKGLESSLSGVGKNVRHGIHGLAQGIGFDVRVSPADGGGIVADDLAGYGV